MDNGTFLPYSFPKRNTFIGYISGIAIYLTLFASFSFIGTSLLGMSLALLVIVFNFHKLKLTTFQFFVIIFCIAYFAFVLFYSLSYVIVLKNSFTIASDAVMLFFFSKRLRSEYLL